MAHLSVRFAEAEGELIVFQSALYRTTSTVVATPDLILLVDPAWLPEEVEAIRLHVEQLRRGRPLFLLLTHSDFDHVLGYGAFPGATTIASRTMAERPVEEKAKVVEEILAFDDAWYLSRGYPVLFPPVDIAVEQDGQALERGRTRLVFYKAPGHTADGLFTVVEPLGVWIAGDYLSDLEFPLMTHSSTAYEQTLAKAEGLMHRHEIRVLVPGHGSATQDRREMTRRLERSWAYIRELREAVRAQDEARLERMIEGCPFPRALRASHQANQALIARELGLLQ